MEYRLTLPKSQHRVQERLLSALEGGRFPRVLLIVGAAGIGKRSLAVELARALSCLSETVRPCGECLSCASYDPKQGKSSWFWLLPVDADGKTISGDEPSAAAARAEQTLKAIQKTVADLWSTTTYNSRSSIRVDGVRDLIKELSLRERRVRVVLVPNADRMELSAANALLKTLEEVPDNTYFILTTANRTDLLPTILSRCTQIHLPEAPLSEVGDFLEERGFSTDQLGSIWALSSGSPGQAMIWAGEKVVEVREMALRCLEWSAARDSSEALLWWSKERESGKSKEANRLSKEDVALLFQILALLLGDLAQLRAGLTIRNLDSSDRLAALPFSQEGFGNLQAMMDDLNLATRRLAGYVTPERVVLGLVLRWRKRGRLNLEWRGEGE